MFQCDREYKPSEGSGSKKSINHTNRNTFEESEREN